MAASGPEADKYPGWSPYNYTLNNPLRFIDPKGEEVYNPYDPYKEDEKEMWEYVERTISIIKQSTEGLRLFNKLNDAKEKFIVLIADLPNESAEERTLGQFDYWIYKGGFIDRLLGNAPKLTGGTISLDPWAIQNSDEDTPAEVLGHEFKHAAMAINDFKTYLSYSIPRGYDEDSPQGIMSHLYNELPAERSENIIRQELQQRNLLKNYGLNKK